MNHIVVSRSLFILLSAFCLTFSCRKDKLIQANDPAWGCTYGKSLKDVNEPNYSEDDYFKIHLNNYWVYADSVWDEEGALISDGIDTMRPISLYEMGGDRRWRFNDVLPALHQRNDTIWSNQGGMLGCSYKVDDYFPTTSDTVNDWTTRGGDIMVERLSYQIPSFSCPASTSAIATTLS